MKNKKSIIIGVIIGVIIVLSFNFIIPIIHENKCKSRVYEDMKKNEDIIKNQLLE